MKLKSTQLKLTPGTIISLIVLGLAVLCALFPQLFTSQDPNQGGDTTALLQPSFQHWFGTDAVGRDLYTRVVYGARQSLLGALSWPFFSASSSARSWASSPACAAAGSMPSSCAS